MKKSRIIALLTAAMMIMSVVPAYAAGYFIGEDGTVYDKDGENLVSNPGFEEGLIGLTTNADYYEVSEEEAHGGNYSLKAIQSTKGDGAINVYFPVANPDDSYYLSFWYKNVDEVARRPRVTFAFADADKNVTDDESTNAWINAGTASNDQDMVYSKGDWVQYSTVITGTGNANDCSFVVLNVYGLTKDVTYVDDFEVYALAYSEEYGDVMAEAIEKWNEKSIPEGPLTGFGTLNLPRETGVENVLVEWTSSDESINAETGEYSSQAEQKLTILTARLYVEGMKDEVFYEFEYPYIVQDMFGPYVEWIAKEVFGKLGTAVSGDIKLPTSHSITGYYPATITWSATDAIAPDGTFTAPDVTKYVDLTATIECNGETTTTTKRVKAIGGNLIAEGLEMYYDFESKLENKKVYDNAQKSYNATTENVTIVDGYANINGGTIILPGNYPQNLTGSYSVSMWVKLSPSMATSAGMYRFFDFGGDSYTSQFLRYIPATNQLTFMDRELAGNGSNWAIDTTAEIGKSGWSLVSFTYDMDGGGAALATVYVDGVKVADSSGCTYLTRSINQINSSSNTGFVGRTQWNNADNPDYLGYMDDVRIYSRVLTADEIATLYNETRPTVTAPVTIKYVDEDGETIKDDVIVSADVDTTYDVPASYKNIPSTTEGQYRHVYKYIAAKSTDSITVNENPDRNVCTLVFKFEKQAKGTNLIENGSFEDGTAGWTNRQGTDITDATVEYDSSIGANVMKIATGGKSGTNNIGTVWNVEVGKEYTISFDIYATAAVSESNYQFNRLTDGFRLGDVGQRENSGNGIIEWGEGLTVGSWTHFTKDFTAATDTLYFQSSWTEEMKYTNFVLEEASAASGPDDEEDDSEKVPVTVRFLDRDGNEIKEEYNTDVKYVTGGKYTVPASVKNLEDEMDGSVIYKYTYVAEESNDTVELSILQDNICTLVYDVIKADKNSNIMVDGGFDDGNGKFSWGTWQSPETQGYFANTCQDWFYQVNRDTNAAALYLTGLTAEDYALGTRWNDGTNGLCSMANFVPVEKGKTYIVSYDYKHQTAGTDGSYISTSFVTSKSMTAGAVSGSNTPKNVTTDWQTNTFTITAPSDGYIYFHFSWLGSGGPSASSNNGSGPYWYFDNFEVLEVITFENEITYSAGYAEIVAEDGTTGYLVQAMYDEEGALVSFVISEELTLSKEVATRVAVEKGAKLMLIKDLTSLEPLAPSIIAE